MGREQLTVEQEAYLDSLQARADWLEEMDITPDPGTSPGTLSPPIIHIESSIEAASEDSEDKVRDARVVIRGSDYDYAKHVYTTVYRALIDTPTILGVINRVEDEYHELENELTDTAKENEHLNHEVSDLSERVEGLEHDLTEMENERDHWYHEWDEMDDRYREATGELEEAMSELEEARSDRDDYEAVLQRVRDELIDRDEPDMRLARMIEENLPPIIRRLPPEQLDLT